MPNNAKIVMKGFTELSDSEKREFLEELRKYQEKDYFEKGRMDENFQEEVRRILGPTSSNNCPCCGR